MALKGERIASSDLERPRILLILTVSLALLAGQTGCGESDPDPATVLDRALTGEKLAGFGSGPQGSAGGVVAVEALGYGDRVLDERRVVATPAVMAQVKAGLGADSGLRGLAEDLRYDGTENVSGSETDHISGQLDVEKLGRALGGSRGEGLGALAGVPDEAALRNSLASADFDLFAGSDDGVIRRLDLTLALDDPDNALPPTRIRFSLTPRPRR